jgi:thiamine biosynthesis protein ThiS
MTLKLNGEWREVDDAATIGALLDQLRITHQAVGVLQNGVVIAREAFAEAPVHDRDELEIVRFVGGG